jgi:hypothetical protein
MQETETEIMKTLKALHKEEEAKKDIVNLKPWRRKNNLSPVLDGKEGCSIQSPPRRSPTHSRSEFRGEWTPKGRLDWTSKREISEEKDGVGCTPLNHSPQTVFSPRSYGSLTSQCTIQSFLSPDKAGIRGCQSKFNPYLHKYRGPCELCMFRLTDEEKVKLDMEGRHLRVQFTTGGCPDCQVFPTSFDEPPVRLCPKCYSMSHRCNPRMRKTPLKKGFDSARIGYSFAKVEYSA